MLLLTWNGPKDSKAPNKWQMAAILEHFKWYGLTSFALSPTLKAVRYANEWYVVKK
jgi:hypothetical protein